MQVRALLGPLAVALARRRIFRFRIPAVNGDLLPNLYSSRSCKDETKSFELRGLKPQRTCKLWTSKNYAPPLKPRLNGFQAAHAFRVSVACANLWRED